MTYYISVMKKDKETKAPVGIVHHLGKIKDGENGIKGRFFSEDGADAMSIGDEKEAINLAGDIAKDHWVTIVYDDDP